LKRKQIYNVAKQKAIETKKPLMIIGDPDNGATNFVVGRSYDCGNLCVDITGCPKCSNGIKLKVEDYLPTLESNSYVLFVSCVLEYVDSKNIDFTFSEIKRVSGGDYFIVSVEPYSITDLFYPTKFITGESGPNQIVLTEYPSKDLKYIILQNKYIKVFHHCRICSLRMAINDCGRIFRCCFGKALLSYF
jgi:hypothetical protein